MNDKIFNLLALLENDLADIYELVKDKSKLGALNEVFDYMITHSREHADRILRMRGDIPSEEIDDTNVMAFQKRLKTAIISHLGRQNARETVQEMITAEEITSNLYTNLASHFRNVSVYFRLVADDIEKLANEELDHKEYLEKEVARHKTVIEALDKETT